MRVKGMAMVIAGALVVALAMSGAALAASGALDGKTFAGQVGEPGKTQGDPDELIFQSGALRSTACDTYGFKAGEYHALHRGDLIEFDAVTTSATDGAMQWKGTVQRDRLEGTATWTRPGKSPVTHWVKATLKK